MFIWLQTGILIDATNGHKLAIGYAGKGNGKNNPDAQTVKNEGPPPAGWYSIEAEPFNSPINGPFCLRLTPKPSTEMFGRSGFLIHGDSLRRPGTASEGCIILSRAMREHIHASKGNRSLLVINA